MDWRITVTGQVDSTQDFVRTAAETGETEGFALQALQQTMGRGRHGNSWTSPMGNLYISVLLRPDCTVNEAGQLAFVAGLALSEAMDRYLAPGHVKALKWPNDILIDGKKVSGLLLEANSLNNRCDYVILGTGVNILAPPEGRVGLDSLSDGQVPIHPFRDLYLEKLADWYAGWKTKGFAPVRAAWLKQAYGLGQPVKVRLPESSCDGVFKTVDETGALIMDADGTEKIFTAGDVHFGE